MSPASHTPKRAERFEFSAARNTAVFICARVRDGAPVLHVTHDADGDWQFLCGGQVKLRPVRDRASYDEHLGYAIWFYNGRQFPVLQLVWPDKTGRFPGEEGVAESLATLQPLLP